jgi:O-antigen ligase
VVSASAVGLLFVPIHWALRTFAIAFVLYLLAFEFQTRGALIWSTFGIVCFGSLLVYKRMTSGRQHWLGFAVLLNLVAAALIVLFFSFEWIFFDVLQANSATRGIDSGLTGRIEMWAFFLSLFAERPLFGYGFDMSRFYAVNYLSDGLGSAHNSYITLLFDFGIVGFSVYIILLIFALITALRSRTLLPLGFISIYLLIGLTESRPLNVGNPSGIFFAIFIPYLAGQAFRRPFQTRVTRKSLPHLGYS